MRFFYIFFISVLFFSCGNNKKLEISYVVEVTREPNWVTCYYTDDVIRGGRFSDGKDEYVDEYKKIDKIYFIETTYSEHYGTRSEFEFCKFDECKPKTIDNLMLSWKDEYAIYKFQGGGANEEVVSRHDNGDPHEIHYFELVNEEKQLVLAEKYTKGKGNSYDKVHYKNGKIVPCDPSSLLGIGGECVRASLSEYYRDVRGIAGENTKSIEISSLCMKFV